MSSTTPGIGHNRPPVPTPMEITRTLAEIDGDLLIRRDQLEAGIAAFRRDNPEIHDEVTKGEAGDFIKQLAGAIKLATEHKDTEKRPYIDANAAIEQFYRLIVTPLRDGMTIINATVTRYSIRVEEFERKAREEAARLAREESARLQRQLAQQQRDEQAERERQAAAQAPPAAPPRPTAPEVTIEEAIAAATAADQAGKAASVKSADLSRTRGDAGSVSSLREVWDVELIDLSQVPTEFLIFNVALARKVVVSRGVRAIPGVRVFMAKHNVSR